MADDARAMRVMPLLVEIIGERERQVWEEGFTSGHDAAKNRDGELGRAAACYAMHGKRFPLEPPPEWPWHHHWWRPKTRRRDLIRAAALIVAELERLDDRPEDPHDTPGAAAIAAGGNEAPGGNGGDG